MKSRLAIPLAAAITAFAAVAAAYDYTLVVEVTEHANLRKAASTSAEVASELPAGGRLAADPVEVEAPKDPKCTKWYAAEYQMGGGITVHGFVCTRVTRIVR